MNSPGKQPTGATREAVSESTGDACSTRRGVPVVAIATAFQDGARELNEDIFETIYFAACEASMELAQVDGTYETYAGGPGAAGG